MDNKVYVLYNLDKTKIVDSFNIYSDTITFIESDVIPEVNSTSCNYLQAYLDEHKFLYNNCVIGVY